MCKNPDSKRILIFSGGNLGPWALEEIHNEDYLIGADRGALFLVSNGYKPDLALGDFDSVNEAELASIRSNALSFYNCDPIDKDLTDTEMAMEWAFKLDITEIVLLGVLGSRFDHTLANVHLLKKALDQKISCTIIDECNELRLVDRHMELPQLSNFSHISLLPLSLEVSGITLTGFKYPLHHATLRMGQSFGISNQIEEAVGQISIQQGLLLIIRSKDYV